MFKPTLATSLLFDFKRLDLKTGVMEDFGFALQYLVHSLKNNLFLIGGQYQIPVFKGKVPAELIDSLHLDTANKRVTR